jgi:SAM-dependent methyltransferase
MARLRTAGKLLLRPRAFLQVLWRTVLAAAGADLPVGDRYRRGGKADAYDEVRATSPTWNWEHAVIRRFLGELPRGAAVLDVPFGTGRFVPLYVERGIALAGLDRSADMLRQARARHPEACAAADLRVGSSTRLPFADGSFDATVCVRFLPGIVDRRAVRRTLAEIGRVTRGTAVLQFKHAETDVPERWIDRFSRLGPSTPHRLSTLLTEAGLRTTRIEAMPGTDRVLYFCTYFCTPVRTARTDRPSGPIRRRVARRRHTPRARALRTQAQRRRAATARRC